MRFVQVMVPAGKRETVLAVLDEEGIDYVVTDETSGREYTAVVSFPLPTNAVEPTLANLREVGIDEDAHTVVVDAETVVSRKFARLQERYDEEEENDNTRIAREEIRERAAELAPEWSNYLIMTVISAVVATAGILIDSPAIVVGSMVIAPLVGPAMATSVGSVVRDDELVRQGVKLQVGGIVAATVAATVFAFVTRTVGLVPPNLDLFALSQFQGRLTPDFLSLVVALGAGVAGAVSIASGVSIALVGVMIAAALVPPLGVLGLGIAYWHPMTILSTGVLVLVNTLSINLTALVVLYYKGYRPDQWFERPEARRETLKRIGALVVAIAFLSLFLGGVTYASYQTTQYENSVQQSIQNLLQEDRYQQLEFISADVKYDDQLPFRQVDRVVVTVGRPIGTDSPRLASTIYRRLQQQTDPPLSVLLGQSQLKVQVRYIGIDTASSGRGGFANGTTNGSNPSANGSNAGRIHAPARSLTPAADRSSAGPRSARAPDRAIVP